MAVDFLSAGSVSGRAGCRPMPALNVPAGRRMGTVFHRDERRERRSPAPDAHNGRVRCALTIDVEDWYQSSIDLDAPITERVPRNVERLLTVLDECGVKA